MRGRKTFYMICIVYTTMQIIFTMRGWYNYTNPTINPPIFGLVVIGFTALLNVFMLLWAWRAPKEEHMVMLKATAFAVAGSIAINIAFMNVSLVEMFMSTTHTMFVWVYNIVSFALFLEDRDRKRRKRRERDSP